MLSHIPELLLLFGFYKPAFVVMCHSENGQILKTK